MSLATRCPHCNTAFRLVRDQLLLSQGWVRCGRCGEAFNAAERQFTFEPASEGVDASSPVSAIHAEKAMLLDRGPDDPESNSPSHPLSTDPTAALGLTSVSAAAAALRTLGAGPSITASPWQVGAFAYAPLAPKPTAVVLPPSATHEAGDEPIEAQATPEATASIAHTDLRLMPPAGEDDRDWLLEALASEATTLGLTSDDAIAIAPGASADAAIQLGTTTGDGEAQASSSWSSATELLSAPLAIDHDLATFSAEAEAALRSASPPTTPDPMDGDMAASPQPAVEDPVRQPLAQSFSAQLHSEANKDSGEHPLDASHPFSEHLDPGHVGGPSATNADADRDDETGEESRFDLGAVLHYQFEPDVEPTLDGAARVRQHAAGADNEPVFASSEIASAPRAEDERLPSAAMAPVVDVAPAAPLSEPQFLRQARARERWERPAIRGLLAALSLLLVAAGAAQAAWTWRDAIAARWPQARPSLARLCAMTGCTLGAPRRPQDLVIDTSSMAPDAQGVLKLRAALRNRSAEPVAYPALELTLTDMQDRIVARKVIEPMDYLRPLPGNAVAARQHILDGLAAGAELSIQLNLHLSKDQASGYTLYAFYP